MYFYLTTEIDTQGQGLKFFKPTLSLVLALCIAVPALATESGVTEKTIRVGSTLALSGDYKVYGLEEKQGIEAALAGQTAHKRSIELDAFDDQYSPDKAVEGTKQLIDKGIFAMVASHGTAAAMKILPVLAEHKIPAFGFYNGAGFTAPGDILNFRATYSREVESVFDAALAAGLKPAEMCMYAQLESAPFIYAARSRQAASMNFLASVRASTRVSDS